MNITICSQHCHFRADLYLCLSIVYICFWQKLLIFYLKKLSDCSCHVELHQIMWNLNRPIFTTYLSFFITLNIVPACSGGQTGTCMETYVYEWEFTKWECSCSWLAFAIHYVSLPLRALCPSPWLTPTPKAVSPGDAPAQAGLTLGAAAERGGAATAPSTLPSTRVQLLLLLLLCQWHSRPCAL